MTRHDGRYGVLVDQLRVPVPSQQHAEIIEPGHDALQLHPVDQKYGERDFCFADVIEEGVLQVLSAFGCHGRFPFLPASLSARVSLPRSTRVQVMSHTPLCPTQKRFKAREALLDGRCPRRASTSWRLPSQAAEIMRFMVLGRGSTVP